jgi:divalent metal cation (Fe/Co/Zn/Cd) transporter
LIGFGLDSLVEMGSGLVILWQFRHPVPESRERLALRLIGVSFFTLAAYVSVESIRNLVGGGEPAPSPVGIVLATLSLLVMPVLSWAQRWSWADPVAGLVIAAVAVREGVEAWRGDACCDPVTDTTEAVSARAHTTGEER